MSIKRKQEDPFNTTAISAVDDVGMFLHAASSFLLPLLFSLHNHGKLSPHAASRSVENI